MSDTQSSSACNTNVPVAALAVHDKLPSESSSQRKAGVSLARRRYQKGTLLLRGKREQVWVGRWLEDEILPTGERCAVVGRKSSAPKKSFRPNALHNDNWTPEYRSSTAPHTGHVLPLRFGN